jgi:hypothetical protein
MKNAVFKVTYISNVDFLKWEVMVIAQNMDEAQKMIYDRGKIVSIEALPEK